MTPLRQRRAACLLLLWGLALVASGLHRSAERHVVCLEHQALEHADEAGHHGPPLREHDDEASGDEPSLLAGEASTEEHEACQFGPQRRDEATPPTRTPAPPAALASGVLPSRAVDERGHAPVPLLALAPKTSPPATRVSIFA